MSESEYRDPQVFEAAAPASWRRIPTPRRQAMAVPGSATPDASKIDALLASALGHHRADRLEEAESLYREILASDPKYPDALHLLGLIGHQFGQHFQASELIMAAIAVRPQAIYYYNLGNVMQANNRPAAAAECFRQAIAMQPDYVDAYNNLGNALRQQGELTAAVESFVKVITLKQDHAQAYNNLGNTLMELDELDAAIESYGSAIALRPELPVPRSNMLFALNYRSDLAPQAYLEEASRFDEAATRGVTAWLDWLVQPALRTDRPLRVGIVSGDLKQHPVGYFLESVVKNLDTRRVELYAYPTRDAEDVLTARIKARFASWKGIGSMTDEAAAKLIRNDHIDVLIDASGHTVHNRLPVFAWKPAPVQVTWPGYFASTGVKAIDYILADRHVLPASEASHFTETPWLLPDSYLCFTPPIEFVQVNELPMVVNGYPTFGYFGKLAKISEPTLAVWARLLHAVPDSRLFLKAQHLDARHASEAMYARFASHGIDASRLIFEGRSPRAAYLDAYRRVDIALSPFPYPGGTTTAEALWMGVPVVCLRVERFLSHICESVLHSAGLPDWIAASADEYIAKAAAYASNIEQLRALRGRLRTQLLASPLCDATRFARNLEDALHGMWARHVSMVTESTQ